MLVARQGSADNSTWIIGLPGPGKTDSGSAFGSVRV